MKYIKERINEKTITYIVFMSLVLIIALGAAFAPKEITIYQGQSVEKVYTTSQNVGEALIELGLEQTEELFVVPGMDAKIVAGMEIHIFNTENIRVYVDGMDENISMPLIDMRYLLSRQGIFLEETDKIDGNIFVEEEKYVKVIRVTTGVIEREVEINFNTVLRPNHELFRGERRILTPGVKGSKLEVVHVTYEDNIPAQKQVLAEEIIQEPRDQIMEFGTKERIQSASRNSVLTENQRIVKEMIVESTAYTHTGNTTFTGIWPYEGVVAVDPRVIPLGTKMYVEGYGYATAADTGGLIKGNIIDVFMDTHEKAVNWGRRQVKIYILE
ncbi:3D domain-containing protein [Desulfitibacter alkalitolerans]|uniref:3D domain-containing protein n=1 Tax=Desulfitibacter alkalitolerans TaxID=264641 RepID=UPI0006857C0E|nr:3D domain-containing protein [Desulfitibacter alkalitolerans]